MNVLVAYATKYGSTQEIAERIALDLTSVGCSAEAAPVTSAVDLAKYDAFVIGSAVFYGRWMSDAVDFVQDHEALLKERPVWLFSSGPLGELVKDGRDQRETAVPADIAELERFVRLRGHRVFFGRLEKGVARGFDGFIANVMRIQGDFRDWDDVDGWARDIAHALVPVAV